MASFINSYRDVFLRKTFNCDLCNHVSGEVPKTKCEIDGEMVCQIRCADFCSRCRRTVCLKHVMLCTLRDSEDCHQLLCVHCAEEDFISWGRSACCKKSYGCPSCRAVHKLSQCVDCAVDICYKRRMYCLDKLHLFCGNCLKKNIKRRSVWDIEGNLREVKMCEYCYIEDIRKQKPEPCLQCNLGNEIFLCINCKTTKVCKHTSRTCGSRHRFCLNCSRTELISKVQTLKSFGADQTFAFNMCSHCLKPE